MPRNYYYKITFIIAGRRRRRSETTFYTTAHSSKRNSFEASLPQRILCRDPGVEPVNRADNNLGPNNRIPVRVTSRNIPFRGDVNTRNISNLIPVSTQSKTSKKSLSSFVPCIMLSNTMSLVPKLVEVHEFILRNRVDIGFITETWLRDTICDSVVDIPGYKVFRKDRKILQHGGVCIYLKDGISYKILEDLRCCDEHEIIWLKLRPTRLPRGFTCLVVAVVYHPPGSDPHTMLNHLFNSLSNVESTFLNCGLIVVGDFNRLDVSSLKRHFKLKQTVNLPLEAKQYWT